MNAITKVEGGALALPEEELMTVLQSSLYPGAALPSIRMVLGYCKAAGLDPMQKPVHIVPMWDSKAKQMRDVIMPGVNLYRTQASRSGAFAGMSEPEFGPDVTDTLGNQKITYPEWCRVTVKRQLASGAVAEFTAREFWVENYAIKGGAEKSIAPNAMWTKRPRGQIAKCAAAQALRIAFPEIASQPTAEEMEGKAIHVDEMVVEAPPARPAPIPWPDEAFSAQMIRWDKAVQMGLKTPADILALARSKGELTPAQEAQINALRKAEAPAAEVVEPGWGDDSMKKEEGGQA
jgi:phage recombination protein Bet